MKICLFYNILYNAMKIPVALYIDDTRSDDDFTGWYYIHGKAMLYMMHKRIQWIWLSWCAATEQHSQEFFLSQNPQ